MMEDMSFFDEGDLRRLFEKWTSEAQDYKDRKTRFDKYMIRQEEAKIPFRKRQDELLREKRKKDKNAHLTVEELDEIWRPFREIRRRIEDEIYGNK